MPISNPDDPRITKSRGYTEHERYLRGICEKTFLSLWSYPSVFNGEGKELCDLLVVFDKHVIIFSDKNCQFPESDDLQLDWSRWFRRAVQRSAKQAWGAERWIRSNPTELFLDPSCLQPFPYDIPPATEAHYHLLVVAHGSKKRCTKELGGSGSLHINTSIKGDAHIGNESSDVKPFYLGDIDPSSTFVHVLDDVTLNILLNTLDTITDFTDYLSKKEELLRSQASITATGEEDLLAFYLKNVNDKGLHDFVAPKGAKHIEFEYGHWHDFQRSVEFISKQEADKRSYYWDSLIEQFTSHFINNTQHFSTHSEIRDIERVLRFMASESRLERRMLANAFIDLIKKPPHDSPGIRYVPRPRGDQFMYVFCVCPQFDFTSTHEQYRQFRYKYLQSVCKAVKHRLPDLQMIVGIATEPGLGDGSRSEDAVYLDAREWNEEHENEAAKLADELGIMSNPQPLAYRFDEYPVTNSPPTGPPSYLLLRPNEYPRNAPCPCESGRKWKHCHGR